MATARGAPQGQDEEPEPSVFEQYPVGLWEPDGGEAITFPVEEIHESRGKRIVEHERPYRPGAKLDDTDWRARRWDVKSCWNNTLQEDGIDASLVLYPTLLNALIRSFDLRETGNLTLPTVGLRRARLSGYERHETQAEIDTAETSFVWIEDSEDNVDASSFQDPSVRASVVRLAQQTVFSAESIGAWDEDLVDLVEFASELEGLMRSPFTTLEDIQAQTRRNRRAIQRILKTQRETGERVGGLFSGTDGATASRELVQLEDMLGIAEEEIHSSRPRTRTISVEDDTDLFSVAASLGQDPMAVLEINAARVDDPLDLRAGDSIRVFV